MLGDLTRLFSSFKDITYAANFYIYCLCLKNFTWIFLDNVLDSLIYIFPCSKKCKAWKVSIKKALYKTETKKTTKESNINIVSSV